MEKFIKLGGLTDSANEDFKINIDGLVFSNVEAGSTGSAPVWGRTRLYYSDGNFVQLNHTSDLGTQLSTGTADTNTPSKLVDTTANFDDDGVAVGDVAFNMTDGRSATVTAVDSGTSLSLSSDAFPDGDEEYVVSKQATSFSLLRAIQDLVVSASQTHWRDNEFTLVSPVVIDAVTTTW